MDIAIFQKYEDGFFSFLFDDGTEVNFEEIHPKALYQYNLKEDKTFIEKSFKLSFSEVLDTKGGETIIYRIDRLVLVS